MFKTIAACAAALLVSACSTTSPLQFRPTMGGDQAALGMESVVYLNELQRAYILDRGNCVLDAVPSLQNAQSESFRRLKRPGESDAQAAKRLGCLRFRTSDVGQDDYTRHLKAGLALADLYCDDYFRRIAVRKQTRQFGRSTTNDVGTAASAALGLATAGSVVTGGAGVLFGLLDGIYRNYDAAFVVEPDLGKMLDLVKTAQTQFRDNVTEAPPASFADANSAITAYAQLCSYAGMDELLNVALEAGSDPETIEQVVARFQTAGSRQESARETKKAEELEAKLQALQRQRAAQEQIDALGEQDDQAGEAGENDTDGGDGGDGETDPQP